MKSDGVIHYIEEFRVGPIDAARFTQVLMTACGRRLEEVGRYSSYVSNWNLVTCKLCLRCRKQDPLKPFEEMMG